MIRSRRRPSGLSGYKHGCNCVLKYDNGNLALDPFAFPSRSIFKSNHLHLHLHLHHQLICFVFILLDKLYRIIPHWLRLSFSRLRSHHHHHFDDISSSDDGVSLGPSVLLDSGYQHPHPNHTLARAVFRRWRWVQSSTVISIITTRHHHHWHCSILHCEVVITPIAIAVSPRHLCTESSASINFLQP